MTPVNKISQCDWPQPSRLTRCRKNTTLLCCAAAQSILCDHPSEGGTYAASEDPPSVTNFACRRCCARACVRVRDFLLQFAVVPPIVGPLDAGASACAGPPAPA